jgi:hypothetical protein
VAISGFANITVGNLQGPDFEEAEGLQVYPNPTTREIVLSETIDFAIYDVSGRRTKVFRNTKSADVSDLTPGIYFIKPAQGKAIKLVVQ